MKSKPLSPDLDKIEMLPDAWERTERAIKDAAKTTPSRPATALQSRTERSAKRKVTKRVG